MNFINASLYNIFDKYKNDQLNNQIENIHKERHEIKNNISLMMNNDKNLLNKFYLNNMEKQIGGGSIKFDKETIDKLDKLKDLFSNLESLDVTKIEENNNKLRDATQKIIDLIDNVSSTKIDVEDIMYKMPQQLDTTRINLEKYNNGIQVFPELAKIYAPMDVTKVSNLLNSSALSNMLNSFNKRFLDIKSKPDTISAKDDMLKIKGEIDEKINELNITKIEMKNINEKLMKKIKSFDENIKGISIDKKLLKFVNSDSEFINDFIIFCNGTPSLDNEIKLLFDNYIDEKSKNNLKEGKTIFDFITDYNKIIKIVKDLTIPKTDRKLPSPRYIGTDTKPIANNMIRDPTNISNLMPMVKNLLKIKIDDEFDGTTLKNEAKFEEIYKPNFSGGGEIEDIESLLQDINSASRDYRKEYIDYVRNTEKYNKYTIYELSYTIYLFSILTNTLFVKSGYQVYKYIGRGMINFYKRIIEKIYKDLKLKPTDLEDKNRLIISEIRKKYFITILKLKNFLDGLSQILTPKEIIDIDNCDESIVQNFVILNHFKTILEKYNESSMNKLTIYGRVNDINMRLSTTSDYKILDFPIKPGKNLYNDIDDETFNSNKNDNDYMKSLKFAIDNKLFISDYDRRNIYAGYYILKELNKGDMFDTTKNQLLDKELRKFPEILNGQRITNIDATKQYIYDQVVFQAYGTIKDIFESTKLTLLEKIDELEKFKKIELSKIIEEAFNRAKNIFNNIADVKNRISELQGEIDDIFGQMDDIIGNELGDKKERKDEIDELIKDKGGLNEKLAKEKQNIEFEVSDASNALYDEKLANKLINDIKNIQYTIKLALEYLNAINTNVSEKLLWVRNFTCDAQKDCSFKDGLESFNIENTDTQNSPKQCDIKNKKDVPYLNSYKFTEVFDTQNFQFNSDMAAYMCLNTRLTSGNGVCLITYGYSGTGKSYTLFGKPGLDGLLQGTLNKLDGLDKIYFRLFEIYGKGLPYTDYWTETDTNGKQKTKIDQIYNYLYAYKLAYNSDPKSDRIDVIKPNVKYGNTPKDKEWGVELYGDQIKQYINKIDDLRAGKDSTYEAVNRNNPSESDNLSYLELSGDIYQSVFQKFKNFTDKIEQMRIDTQRVRETPNNKVSSRSILVYDFVLIINKTPVSFLIIDLPGREEIGPTFINKYTDLDTNKVLYDIIKNGFEQDSSKYPEHRKLFNPSEGNIGDVYMKELRAMLSAFTLNPLTVPIYSTEIIEKYVRENYTKGKYLKTEIFEKEMLRKYTLRGELNGQFAGTEYKFEKAINIFDEFYDTNFSEKLKLDDPKLFNIDRTILDRIIVNKSTDLSFDDIIHRIFYISKHYMNSHLGWNTFNNILSVTNDGDININPIVSNLKATQTRGKLGQAAAPVGDPYETPIPAVSNWNSNHGSDVLPKKIKKRTLKPKTKNPEIPTTYRYVYGLENDKHNGRQIKTLFFMHFMKRLFELQRYDIINELFEKIVDEKINYYIKEYIKKSDNTKCQELVNNLIEANFKREALREKFLNDKNKPEDGYITIKKTDDTDNTMKRPFNIIDPISGKYEEDFLIERNIPEYLYESIKYDFYTTGFEGIYINENIIGLIKYLGKDGKPKKDANGDDIIGADGKLEMNYLIQNSVDREMIEIIKQNKFNTFEYGYKIGKMTHMSRMEFEGKQKSINIASDNIKVYGEHAKKTIDDPKYVAQTEPTPQPGQQKPRSGNIQPTAPTISKPAWQTDLEEGKIKKSGGTTVGFMQPVYTKYDKNKKLKVFDIRSENYMEQIFKKDNKITNATELKNWLVTEPTVFPTVPDYGNYFYNPVALDKVATQTLDTYKSSKIFCYDEPIIKSILEPYLDIINDFKIFYLFGNYTKATRELKCAQQYELLETTNNFIEAITR
jgi:hypothetical protein